jgi:DNA anti-recombination protein RmuC
MKIEERAMEIINHLNRLRQELDRFTEDFRKVGMHLANAQTRFGEAEKRLTRFEEKLLNAAGDALTEEPAKIEAAPPPQN